MPRETLQDLLERRQRLEEEQASLTRRFTDVDHKIKLAREKKSALLAAGTKSSEAREPRRLESPYLSPRVAEILGPSGLGLRDIADYYSYFPVDDAEAKEKEVEFKKKEEVLMENIRHWIKEKFKELKAEDVFAELENAVFKTRKQ
jgi:hypothetical protein